MNKLKHSNADGLSCLPLGESGEDVQEVATIFNLKKTEVLPVDVEQLSKETTELFKVIQYLLQGWPSKVMPAL